MPPLPPNTTQLIQPKQHPTEHTTPIISPLTIQQHHTLFTTLTSEKAPPEVPPTETKTVTPATRKITTMEKERKTITTTTTTLTTEKEETRSDVMTKILLTHRTKKSTAPIVVPTGSTALPGRDAKGTAP